MVQFTDARPTRVRIRPVEAAAGRVEQKRRTKASLTKTRRCAPKTRCRLPPRGKPTPSAAEQLSEKPYPQVRQEPRRKKERKISAGAPPSAPWDRAENRPQHTRDRARSANGRHPGVRLGHYLGHRRQNAAGQVKQGEPPTSHGILDVVTEDPERPHIADDMQPAAMQELVRQECPVSTTGKTHCGCPIGVDQTRRHNAEQKKEPLQRLGRERQLEAKHQDVNQDYRTRHHRHRSRWNGIPDGEHISAEREGIYLQLVTTLTPRAAWPPWAEAIE